MKTVIRQCYVKYGSDTAITVDAAASLYQEATGRKAERPVMARFEQAAAATPQQQVCALRVEGHSSLSLSSLPHPSPLSHLSPSQLAAGHSPALPYHALEAITMADLVERGELLPLTTKQEKLIEEVRCALRVVGTVRGPRGDGAWGCVIDTLRPPCGLHYDTPLPPTTWTGHMPRCESHHLTTYTTTHHTRHTHRAAGGGPPLPPPPRPPPARRRRRNGPAKK